MMKRAKELLQKGVGIPNPASVEIGDEVDSHRISGKNVVIHAGCKIFGSSTLILQGTTIGYGGPVTIENCYIGPQVSLKGGYFKNSVFLKKSSIELGAHVRDGTILEEEASAAHTVGLKQTILFPFVTLGSLVNFCDCFMAGGTDRKNHSEVGSSYIHFNYTPNQDKATPSLLGDVPKGVMLDQPPIFLGGQGGLVGPCRLTYGTITAAGTICRKDELRPGRLLFGDIGKRTNIPYVPGIHQNIARILKNNLYYIANLLALMQWYRHVRSVFISGDFTEDLYKGLTQTLDSAIGERVKQLKIYGENLNRRFFAQSESSPYGKQLEELKANGSQIQNFIEDQMTNPGDPKLMELFRGAVDNGITSLGKDYIAVIKGLKDHDKETGTQWLRGIVDHTYNGTLKFLPSIHGKDTGFPNKSNESD